MHEYQQTKQYVLRRLAAQNYHSNQLKKLLAERCVQVSTINRVVADCLGWGYLNDAAWLESFVRSRLKRQGAQAILSKLYAKGIPLDTARAEIEKWQNPDQEAEAISKLLRTRFRSKNLQDRKERQKVIASLMRKGFKLSAIQHAMQNMPQEEDFF
jgi:regulatory protein